ncbi:unnamed protein product [Gordionus sp. m RMFG-2023]|uniref:nascent polypeptide-associated complex subunit alpha-like n=1 Tax=Gordionus sp. m RMFG-2023 TaxID=3053472 RepID=UPI0030E5D0A1
MVSQPKIIQDLSEENVEETFENPPEVASGSGSESDDESIPELEDLENAKTDSGVGLTPAPVGSSAKDNISEDDSKSKQTRGEKKARKIISKLGLKQIHGVGRITIRKSKNILFIINKPDVYKSPAGDTYIVFGETKIEDLSQQAQMAAAEKFKVPPFSQPTITNPNAQPNGMLGDLNHINNKESSDTATGSGLSHDTKTNQNYPLIIGQKDEEPLDDTGITDVDINIVMEQASVSRNKAIKALREANNDIINAIMTLTL